MITPEQSRAARGLLDWSQNKLAAEAQVSRQTVVDFERGERIPRERNISAMQKAFENHRVEFTKGIESDSGVSLRPSIWKLTPIDDTDLNWKASIYSGELVVRAPSERRARQIAGLALAIAVQKKPGQPTITNPWNRIVGCATCERLIDSDYEDDGPESILFPKQFDSSWRR